ncbi:MAG: IS481 family transposase [Bacteroidota bacterium]
MPWKKEQTTMELRTEFVQLADQPGANISQLCKRFGISRPTGYKWLSRYREHGLDGLQDQSRRPTHFPNKTPKHIEQLIISTRKKFPGWGARKLRHWLCNQITEGHIGSANIDELPAFSTITRILDRNNVLEAPTHSSRAKPWKRFEREAPNQLWQLDFKGEFLLSNGAKCFPLTLLDDHSRFSLALAACPNQQRTTVQQQLKRVFDRYGLPEEILCDNGTPWGAGMGWGPEGPYYTKLAAWLMRLGVTVTYARPGRPQTKGKNERFNGTLQAELLRFRQFSNWSDVRRDFAQWRMIYNTQRPHEALAMDPPAKHYKASCITYSDHLPPINYGPSDIVRKVNAEGRISYQNKQYRVGRAFCGQHVALRAIPEENDKKKVYFCHQHIRTLDFKNKV